MDGTTTSPDDWAAATRAAPPQRAPQPPQPPPPTTAAQRRRHDDPIDSMLQAPMFAQHAPSAEIHPALSLSYQRRAPALPAAHPPHFPSLHTPLPLPAATATHTARFPPLPALVPPTPRRNCNSPPTPTRNIRELLALPRAALSFAERRRVRVALLSRKRRRRSGTAGTAEEDEITRAAKRPALDPTSLAELDKKQIRVIRNRQVALEARQKAKERLHRLESENSNLKNKATNLERENTSLKLQIESLKESLQQGALAHDRREQSWNGDVSLESVIAP